MAGENGEEREEIALSKAGEFLLDECRMVLPGIQTIFGFQLIAVFSYGFIEKLGPFEQYLHLGAISLIVIAIALIMTPAALHRSMGSRFVSETFVRASSRLLLWSMLPLALAICAEFYVVGRVILGGTAIAVAAAVLFLLFIALWFLLPRVQAFHEILGRKTRRGS